MFNIPCRESCRQHFVEHKIMTVPCIYIYKLLLHIKKNIATLSTVSEQHRYPTRHGHLLKNSTHSTTLYERAPSHSGIVLYNKLPRQITDTDNFNSFKFKVKQFLQQNCFYSVQEYLNCIT